MPPRSGPTGQATAVPLEEYRRKRDPKSTPEPFDPEASGGDGQPIFVVQRHDARAVLPVGAHLVHDEVGGVPELLVHVLAVASGECDLHARGKVHATFHPR